jgi:hypothetical protein
MMAGALFSAVGTVFGVIGSLKQAKAAEKAEEARQQQMKLEAMRRRRESLRQATVARATALSNATNQGAGETSSLAGGLAQITNRAARNVQATNQDEALGNKVFEANKDYARASGLIAIGNGISSLGGVFDSAQNSMQRLGWV